MSEPKTALPTPRRQKRTPRKPRQENSGKSKKKKTGRLFFQRWPLWALWTGGLLVVLLYIAGFHYFFIGPSSFRWKAMYGEVDYPDGFKVHGIDVSHYQENIDWERLRNADIRSFPVSFVFIKATEGVSLIDENFNQNFYQARRNDIVRGAYHFFSPDCDAERQARFFLKQVHLEPGDLPPVLDVEKTGGLTPAQLQKAVKRWLDIVEAEYGVKPILYTGYKFKLDYLNTPDFDDYPYWIAHYYVDKLSYQGDWKFWQHTDCGRVDGIRGYVDCNIFSGSMAELKALTIPEEADDELLPEE
ncbi:MAG: glycoside hydrolase family 25 protein [Clostridium sp.]|nr:glycoside hydrolase family 25 protein [Clostridium sp.]